MTGVNDKVEELITENVAANMETSVLTEVNLANNILDNVVEMVTECIMETILQCVTQNLVERDENEEMIFSAAEGKAIRLCTASEKIISLSQRPWFTGAGWGYLPFERKELHFESRPADFMGTSPTLRLSSNVLLKNPHQLTDCSVASIDDLSKCNNGMLLLSPLEAFFLVHALGCLLVTPMDSEDGDTSVLTISALWRRFCACNSRFPSLYRAYLHYRGKGWTVRTGLRMAADFTLYIQSPAFFHASYSVVVMDMRKSAALSGRPPPVTSALDLLTLVRVTERVAKKLLLCYVVFPSDDSDLSAAGPGCLQSMQVIDVQMSRWTAANGQL